MVMFVTALVSLSIRFLINNILNTHKNSSNYILDKNTWHCGEKMIFEKLCIEIWRKNQFQELFFSYYSGRGVMRAQGLAAAEKVRNQCSWKVRAKNMPMHLFILLEFFSLSRVYLNSANKWTKNIISLFRPQKVKNCSRCLEILRNTIV